MKAFDEYRTKRVDEYGTQKKRRLELRCSKYIMIIFMSFSSHVIWKFKENIACILFVDIDTDELDSDSKNVEEEVVEFFIKEETFVVDDK